LAEFARSSKWRRLGLYSSKAKAHHLNCFRATLLGAPEAQMGNQPPPCIRFGLFGRIRALTDVVDPHLKT
jgi:hypothetical protein